MDVQAVIDGRERAQAQVASAKETAETLAQAQAESPEAGELAKLKNELTERRNEMQDLAAALGWKKMFNGTYRSLSKEVKSLEQAVATKEQQMPQKGQQAA
jgi:DNA repair exonuclease SbcCD ATPase subunit